MAERTYTLHWVTLNDIKDQLRIERDNTQEDTLLTRYGATAEKFILRYIQRTEAELKAMNEEDPTQVPEDIVSATLMLCDLYYQYRGPVSMQNLYLIDYGFDALVMPFRKGTYSSVDDEEE